MAEPTLLTIKQASKWASEHIGKAVTSSNISYLIQYGRVRKLTHNGATHIDQADLEAYYRTYMGRREIDWKAKLGDDLNWSLSFDHLKEKETTKHVHRLHPYKGKFIPQLVEYFLDDHIDDFKQATYFRPNDIVLDPFCGSGTTLVQASELNLHAVGIDVSAFNALMANVKVGAFDLPRLQHEVEHITHALQQFEPSARARQFEAHLLGELAQFNREHFPSPDYKRKVRTGELNYRLYGPQHADQFLPTFHALTEQYQLDLSITSDHTFLDQWYLPPIRAEIDFVFALVQQIEDEHTRNIVTIILSRTLRSCRATTHADLATLVDPITTTYYCHKHGKVCKPLFSILSWWQRYGQDTIKRLLEFDELRTETQQQCVVGDSRKVDLVEAVGRTQPQFAKLIDQQKIRGIFSSPPYVGLINYHEQHAYAYDLFGFARRDEMEIGPLFKGKGKAARQSYIEGVAAVLRNCARFLADDYDVFLVSNDKFNMYPQIAERAGMQIVNRFRRPVLNRTERDRAAYAETIFHLKAYREG